jgi:VWFA-related protein
MCSSLVPRTSRVLVTASFVLVGALAAAAFAVQKSEGMSKKELRAAEEALSAKYRSWLAEVFLLITKEERVAFLEIREDYQRDSFIERFWRIRDPYPETPRNELREQWYARLEHAREEFGDLEEDRARYFLMNGPPTERWEIRCRPTLHPIELWYYDGSERVLDDFFLLFVRLYGGPRFTLWKPGDGVDDLVDMRSASLGLSQEIFACVDGDILLRALDYLNRMGPMDYEFLLARIEQPREDVSGEWVATFEAYSTDVEDGVEALPARMELAFPERYGARTVVETRLELRTEDVGLADLDGVKSYNFFVVGEVLREERLFENFRYKFDFPAAEVPGETIPVVFQRRLRPGEYTLIVKLEDLNSERVFREQRALEVPHLEARSAPADPETERVLSEAEAILESDRPTVQLVEPHGDMQTGMLRFETLTTGDIAEMRFTLDGSTVLTKRRPPWTIDFDLGAVPRRHELEAVALDIDGNELASDVLVMNAGKHRFDVRLNEPRKGTQAQGQVRATAEVTVPEGRVVERVELYLNESLVATLYQPPYSQSIPLPAGGGIAYIEAVAYLPDGNSTRAGVFVNGPDFVEEVDIEYVELYVTALDKNGRPVQGLERRRLVVREDGVEQEIRRFEKVDDLPIHAQIMIDVSASMEPSIEQTKRAALGLVRELITPKDRAALITFNDHPHMAVGFTNDHRELTGGLAGLNAQRGTALFDALVFGLYHLNGIKGQRTLLLLSDGKDETSRFTFENALDYARRAGVAIYTIGLDIKGKDSSQARRRLADLADETGGRSFFIETVKELDPVYQTIEDELRSRYLVTYQSTNSAADDRFRIVAVEVVGRSGVEAKTIRGYYP